MLRGKSEADRPWGGGVVMDKLSLANIDLPKKPVPPVMKIRFMIV